MKHERKFDSSVFCVQQQGLLSLRVKMISGPTGSFILCVCSERRIHVNGKEEIVTFFIFIYV